MDDLVIFIAVGLVLAAVISGLICKMFYDQMKTARQKTEANDYVDRGHLVLEVSHDRYMGTFTTKTPINRDNDRPGPPRR
jgi:uncharacterized protein